jgi:copper chaperone CopZ
MNKNQITVIAAFLMLIVSLPAFSQEKDKKLRTIEIVTSAQCGMCKERIEKAIGQEKGVRYASVDLKTKIATVKFKEGKTSPKEIRQAITNVGYDADNMQADKKAYEALPACCKKPWDKNAKKHEKGEE